MRKTLCPAGLEEPGEVLVEDEGDAGEIAEGGDDAAGFELREEAGGEAGEAAELDETHGALEAEALDALAELGGGEKGLGGGGVDGVVVGGLVGLRVICGRNVQRFGGLNGHRSGAPSRDKRSVFIGCTGGEGRGFTRRRGLWGRDSDGG